MSSDSRMHDTMTSQASPSGDSKSKQAVLKERLLEYWNAQEIDRDARIDELAASLTIRGKLASFIPEGSRILDVACGPGANTSWFAPRGKYFGTDISLGFLRLGNKPERHLTCADGEALPFGDHTFDAVTFTYALEHTVNPVKVLREMCRVAGKKGRVILLGPSWDLPFWLPNSLRSRKERPGWHLRYTLSRAKGQLAGWILGRLPFLTIDEPDAFSHPFEADADAVYVMWSYEVIRQMKRWGFRLVHSEVDNQLLGTRLSVKILKRLLYLLPPYRLAGSTVLLVFERNGKKG